MGAPICIQHAMLDDVYMWRQLGPRCTGIARDWTDLMVNCHVRDVLVQFMCKFNIKHYFYHSKSDLDRLIGCALYFIISENNCYVIISHALYTYLKFLNSFLLLILIISQALLFLRSEF